jgi:RHS repeat-associated protein
MQAAASDRTSTWAPGAPAADPHFFGIEWNAENQLKRVLKNAVEQARFAYDPLGNRVERIAGGMTTGWTYDAEDVLRETSGSAALKYVHGPVIDEPLAQEDSAGILSHVHVDGLGSVVRTSDPVGAVTSSRRYEAFGNLEVGATTGYAFTGREWEPSIGLYYYRARYYEPLRGRFATEDPLQWQAGYNFYGFVENNPANFIDPFGLAQVPWAPWGPGPCLGAMWTGKLLLSLGKVVNDKVLHCLAHCYLTKGCGAGGPLLSKAGGSGWEWLDEFRGLAGKATCLMGSCPPTLFDPNKFYDLGDMDANARGRSCPANVTCWENCKDAHTIPRRPRFH